MSLFLKYKQSQFNLLYGKILNIYQLKCLWRLTWKQVHFLKTRAPLLNNTLYHNMLSYNTNIAKNTAV